MNLTKFAKEYLNTKCESLYIFKRGGGDFLYFKIKCKQFLCIHNKQYILINKLYELHDMSMCKFFTIGDLAYKTIY